MAKGLIIEMEVNKDTKIYHFTHRNTHYSLYEAPPCYGGYRFSLWARREGYQSTPPRCFDTLAEVEAVAKGFAGLEALIASLNEDGTKIIH